MAMFIGFLISAGLLISAIVQAVQGDWLPAIFLALLWMGASNNFGLSELKD